MKSHSAFFGCEDDRAYAGSCAGQGLSSSMWDKPFSGLTATSSGLLSLVIALVLFLPCATRAAQAAKTNAPASSNRWLFVVETSKSMQPRREAVSKVVQELLSSSMKGQIQPGDTNGVWTF